MPITTQCISLSSPGEISVSDSEVDGTDYLLSSAMRLDDALFQILGEFFGVFGPGGWLEAVLFRGGARGRDRSRQRRYVTAGLVACTRSNPSGFSNDFSIGFFNNIYFFSAIKPLSESSGNASCR